MSSQASWCGQCIIQNTSMNTLPLFGCAFEVNRMFGYGWMDRCSKSLMWWLCLIPASAAPDRLLWQPRDINIQLGGCFYVAVWACNVLRSGVNNISIFPAGLIQSSSSARFLNKSRKCWLHSTRLRVSGFSRVQSNALNFVPYYLVF